MNPVSFSPLAAFIKLDLLEQKIIYMLHLQNYTPLFFVVFFFIIEVHIVKRTICLSILNDM